MSMTSTITSINTSTHKSNSTHRISNGAQACAACKYQRRKCAPDCILAPYFPHDKQPQFLNAHKLFGVSNITKIIRDLDQRDKDMAMATIIFQSDMRARDPVSGCYGIVRALHYQTEYVKNELEFVRHQITVCRAHQAAYQQQLQISDDKSIKNDPTTLSYEILQEFNDHQSYQMVPLQYEQEYVNAHRQQQQQQQQDMNQPQLQENEDDVSGSEVLNNHPPPQDNGVQDFQYSWSLQDSEWIPSKGSSNREGSPVGGGLDLCKEMKPLTDVNLGHEFVEITSFERGESFKFDQQAIDKSEMILKAENLADEEEAEAFQQHQIPEHDLRSAATLFTLTTSSESLIQLQPRFTLAFSNRKKLKKKDFENEDRKKRQKIDLLVHLIRLVIENNQVPVGDVEAGEMFDGGLSVVDILVDDEGGSPGVLVGADTNLPYGAVLAEDVVHLFAGDVERQVPNIQHSVHLRRKPRVRLPHSDRHSFTAFR
ncbi:hypothetical protein V2J09_005311 [Rumex salicifolius]